MRNSTESHFILSIKKTETIDFQPVFLNKTIFYQKFHNRRELMKDLQRFALNWKAFETNES